MLYEDINLDILELFLSEMHQTPCVAHADVAFKIRHMVIKEEYYNATTPILYMSSFSGLDPEAVGPIYPRLNPYAPFRSHITPFTTEHIIRGLPHKTKVPGVNMDLVKYDPWDHCEMEFYLYLIRKLEMQTKGLNPLLLGERVIVIPRNVPSSFDGIEKMLEDVIDVIPEKGSLDEIEYALEMKKKNKAEKDILTIEKLREYREKYDACISVDKTHRRLYTRGRFIMNMFVDLNHYIKSHVISTSPSRHISLDSLNFFLGEKVYGILFAGQNYPLDNDGYPVFGPLYRRGCVPNITYPFTSDDFCFCGQCPPVKLTMYLYQSKTGQVQIFIVLEDVSFNDYINFITSKQSSCYYDITTWYYERYHLNDLFKKMYRQPGYHQLTIRCIQEDMLSGYIDLKECIPDYRFGKLTLKSHLDSRLGIVRKPPCPFAIFK